MRTLRCRWLFLLTLVVAMLAVPASSFAQVFVSVRIAPPPLLVYEQPLCPGDGYIWTPGYWGYGDDGYFWVPGTWVLAPTVGFLWTPGYWGWGDGVYIWHAGYWGPHVGFYGGINYGFGYTGYGYEGGYWQGRNFYYNRAANNVNVTNIHNTYNTTINNVTVNRVSYNGGNGGVTAQPTAAQQAAARERHIAPTASQTQHVQAARSDRAQFAAVNHGQPAVVATPKPGAFHGAGVVTASRCAAPSNAATNAPRPNNANVARPNNSNPPRPPQQENAPRPNNQTVARNAPRPGQPPPQQHAAPPPQQHAAPAPSRPAEPHGEPERPH